MGMVLMEVNHTNTRLNEMMPSTLFDVPNFDRGIPRNTETRNGKKNKPAKSLNFPVIQEG
jgi:hypothetical protein